MIPGLFLLSVSVFATPVFISEVRAVREAGHLRVEVVGDGGIDPEGARTNIDDGRLFIYLAGTRVRADNRAWDLEDGAGEIRAHRHKTETELVVPLAGNGCAGPVELSGSNTGITALVGCDGTVGESRSGSKASSQTARKVGLKGRSRIESNTVPIAATVAVKEIKAKSASDAETIRALIALPPSAPVAAKDAPAPEAPEAEQVAAIAPAVAAAAGPPAVAPVVVPINSLSRGALAPAAPLAEPAIGLVAAPAAPPARVPSSTSVPAVALATVSPPTGGHAASGTSSTVTIGSTGSGGLGKVAIPAVLLLALAVAAYLFARRRRATTERHIQILESTSLGPKRSLVVARVGNQTLILGSSEAGITLLKSSLTSEFEGVVTDNAADLASSAKELSQTIEEALADIPEPGPAPAPVAPVRNAFRTIEGGLASLFGQRGAEAEKKEASLNFDDLLEDSVEDQELRQKLAAGISARVR